MCKSKQTSNYFIHAHVMAALPEHGKLETLPTLGNGEKETVNSAQRLQVS